MKSMAKSSPKVELVKAAVEKWYKSARKHSRYGACDTEPDTVFQRCLHQKLQGEEVHPIPGNARGWQLYHDMKGANIAARHLTDALLRALTAIEEVPDSERHELTECLDGYLWRFT